MRPENIKMKNYLSFYGIEVMPKFIWTGSLKGTWRLYNSKVSWHDNPGLWDKLTQLGFTNYDGQPFNQYNGNGGMFSLCTRFDRTKEFINSKTQLA